MSVPADVTQKDVDAIVAFIQKTVSNTGKKGVILGISGGLDSAVVTKLSVMAIGPEHVTAVFMPSRAGVSDDERLAKSLAKELGVEYIVIDITKVIDSLSDAIPGEDTPLDRGNLSARCRMSVIYNLARKKDCLVAGTSNRTELMVGYFTKFGDGASDMLPLSRYYKTQVRGIAKLISLPEEFITRPPSAGFWDGQTDEGEIGMKYSELDTVLALLDKGYTKGMISRESGLPKETVDRIVSAVDNSEHKRHFPKRM